MSGKEIEIPGQSKHLVRPSDVDPNFFNRRPGNWLLRIRRPNGTIEEIEGVDWEAVSPFGAVRQAVVVDDEGRPLFDRPRYEEAPSIYAVCWGRDSKDRKIKVALLSQARPHANHPFNQDTREDVVFAQIPMGFAKKIVGEDQIERLESTKETAVREVKEETGVTFVKDIFEPEFPAHNANPAFVGSFPRVVFIEVDLEKVKQLKPQRDELIFKAEFVSLKELMDVIRKGATKYGLARDSSTNGVLMMFFSIFKRIEYQG